MLVQLWNYQYIASLQLSLEASQNWLKIIQKPQSCPLNPQGNSQKKAIDREQGNLQPLNFQDYFLQIPLKDIEQIVGVAQLYFMPQPLLEIFQRLMAHPVVDFKCYFHIFFWFPYLFETLCSKCNGHIEYNYLKEIELISKQWLFDKFDFQLNFGYQLGLKV